VNGSPIVHAEELPRKVARNAPGSTIKVTLIRDRQPREVAATLDMLPDDADAASSKPARKSGPQAVQPADKLGGVAVSDSPSGGVRVDEVADDQIRDLRPGDVIVEANGKPVKTVQDLRAATSGQKPGTMALLKVRRGRLTQFAAVPIPVK
jgi:serine protease Do